MTNVTVNKGNVVTLHYRGTLNDGSEFDSSYDRDEPMTVTVGSGQLISGFDKALEGMSQGETKRITLSPDEAYGERNPEATTVLERSIFPEDFVLEKDMVVPLDGPGGRSYLATLTELNDDTVTADLNHPMAGKDLTFEIEVLEIETTSS